MKTLETKKMNENCYFMIHNKKNMENLKNKYFKNEVFLKEKFINDFKFKVRGYNYTDIYTVYEKDYTMTNDCVSRTLSKDTSTVINDLLEVISNLILCNQDNTAYYRIDYELKKVDECGEFMNFFKIDRDS